MSTQEKWQPIPGYVGIYEASTLGRIRSVDRAVHNPQKGSRLQKGIVRKHHTMANGYHIIGLCRDGKHTTRTVHSLIALTFLGEPNGLDVDHINRDKTDNRLANLRYATRADNIRNTGLRRNNTTGEKGVYYIKARGKWGAIGFRDSKKHWIGSFPTKAEAVQARDQFYNENK